MSPLVLTRFKALFDIYSPNPLSRLVVLATMGVGVILLAKGANTGGGAGAIPFLILVWVNRERFLATVEGLFERNGWFVLAVPLLVLAAKLVLTPPAASDDLLRHMASAFWPGGYSEMYVHSSLPPTSLYPTFDWFAGGLARAIGLVPAMWVIQSLAVGAFVAVFLMGAKRLLDEHSSSSVLILIALVLVLHAMAGRLILARPEIFMTTWALSALLVRGRTATFVWAVAGLLLGSGYWLAVLYFPAVIMLPGSLRARVLLLTAMSALWAALWWGMTDGRLAQTMLWAFEQVGNRLPELTIGENISIVNVLLAPPMLALAFASLWAAGRRGADNRLLLLAAFFLLSNQARYGGIVAPLFALHAMSALREVDPRWPNLARSAIVALSAMSMSVLAASLPKYASMVRFDLPPGSVALTPFDQSTYSTLFANPGEIRVAPAFEVGALERRFQRVVLGLNRGRLDCGELSGSGFTHLIERTLTGPVPPCVALLETQGGWRLWAVR